MTLEDFVALFRVEAKDASAPYLWSDADVVRFTNKALNQMALPVEAGGADYFLDQSSWVGLSISADDPVVPGVTGASFAAIIEITYARLTDQATPLSVLSSSEYSQGLVYEDYGLRVTGQSSDWQTTTGTPKALLTDFTPGGLRLAPIPTQAHTLDLWAQRLPIVELSDISGEDWKLDVGQSLLVGGLGVAQDERVLLDGVKAYAFQDIVDADVYDPDLSKRYTGIFAEGLRTTGYRLRRRRHPPHAVRPNSDYVY